MKKFNFDEINLPKVNQNENLETISNNFFRPLFDVNKFEIRSETVRDKGIDFHIELKKEQASGDSVFTNFRFAVQLKATESIEENTDGSFSMQMYSSNINYLLNNGMPAYYIFYHKPTHSFYYESVNTFFSELQKKDGDWSKQETHALRFFKLLDVNALTTIYQETFDNGILFRQLNQHLKFTAQESKTGGIIIDANNEIYSVAENISYLDQFGPELINGQHFNFIIEIEQRTHPRPEATPRFNLICGIAYFQRGNLYKSMELLKLAQQKSESFEPEIQAMLTYTLLNAKFLLGIMDKEDFEKELSKITEDSNSGTFFEIEKAYNEISGNKVKPAIGIQTFYAAITSIIKKDERNAQMRITAYAKILDAEAVILFHELAMNFTYILGHVNEPLKTRTYIEWLELETAYLKRIDMLIDFALKNRYFLAVSNLTSNKIIWDYKRIFHSYVFNNWKKDGLALDRTLDKNDIEILTKGCEKLDRIATTYEMLENLENMISCLDNKFEILYFIGKDEEAELAKIKIATIIEANDFVGLKVKHNTLTKENNSHEKFIKKYTQHIQGIRDLTEKLGVYVDYDLAEESFATRKPEWSITDFYKFHLPEMTEKNNL